MELSRKEIKKKSRRSSVVPSRFARSSKKIRAGAGANSVSREEEGAA